MLDWVLGRKSGKTGSKLAKGKRPSYEKAKTIAAKGDTEARRVLASFEDLEPELLYFFATDRAPEVRRQVAENSGTPLQADLLLAEDGDGDVRQELARKIGRLVPQLTPDENQRLTEMALKIVAILARDDLPRVRAVIAEELKQASNIPKPLVMQLARDVEEMVAAPVVEYSPLLNDSDLIDLVTSGLAGKALIAVARRRAVSKPVSKAVYDTHSVEAVQALLDNATADIADETMESIAESATERPEWHGPLVDRDNLPVRVVLRVAGFLSSAMLEVLVKRNKNLEPEQLEELKTTVRDRIARGDFPDDAVPFESAEDRAKRMHQKDRLNEKVLRKAMKAGEHAFVRHALVLMSGLPRPQVQRMLNDHNPMAVAALSKKAGLTMKTAEIVQKRIARIKPNLMLQARPDGGYPLTEADVERMLETYG